MAHRWQVEFSYTRSAFFDEESDRLVPEEKGTARRSLQATKEEEARVEMERHFANANRVAEYRDECDMPSTYIHGYWLVFVVD